MEILFAILALFMLSVPFGLAMAYFVGEGPNSLSGFFKSDRGLGWPVGVQEEDAPGWNWQPVEGPEPDPSFAHATEPDPGRPGPAPSPAAGSAEITPYGVAPTRIERVRVRLVPGSRPG